MIRMILPTVFFSALRASWRDAAIAQKIYAAILYHCGVQLWNHCLLDFAGTDVWHIRAWSLASSIGAAGQVLLQFIGLRKSALRFSLDFKHPALRQIVRLYIPMLGGLSVMLVGVAIDRNLASRTGAQSLAWMQAATYLLSGFPWDSSPRRSRSPFCPVCRGQFSGMNFVTRSSLD